MMQTYDEIKNKKNVSQNILSILITPPQTKTSLHRNYRQEMSFKNLKFYERQKNFFFVFKMSFGFFVLKWRQTTRHLAYERSAWL